MYGLYLRTCMIYVLCIIRIDGYRTEVRRRVSNYVLICGIEPGASAQSVFYGMRLLLAKGTGWICGGVEEASICLQERCDQGRYARTDIQKWANLWRYSQYTSVDPATIPCVPVASPGLKPKKGGEDRTLRRSQTGQAWLELQSQ